jgi:hypothetical protein
MKDTTDRLLSLANGYKRGGVRFDFLEESIRAALDQGNPVGWFLRNEDGDLYECEPYADKAFPLYARK